MSAVSFSFRIDVSEDARDALLKEIKHQTGVLSAGLLKPDSKSARIRRMAIAKVADSATALTVCHRLDGNPLLESVELAAERTLVR